MSRRHPLLLLVFEKLPWLLRLCCPPKHTLRKKKRQEDIVDEVDSTETEDDENTQLDEELFDEFYMTKMDGTEMNSRKISKSRSQRLEMLWKTKSGEFNQQLLGERKHFWGHTTSLCVVMTCEDRLLCGPSMSSQHSFFRLSSFPSIWSKRPHHREWNSV